jgi:hypothetical protein
MADEEEKGFEVVDKRRRSDDQTPEQAEASEEPTEDEFDEDEEGDGDYGDPSLTGSMPKLAVSDILRMTVGMLNEKAWIHMGLIPDPLSGQIERDLTEARLAIDALADLAKHLEPHTEGAEKRELQVMVSNLRINFVQQSRM